ncbi:MAG: metallophosphoesterase [Magnetococcales bacterium]|nr:metallophosphoesterase [Magnetococcales bacterium]
MSCRFRRLFVVSDLHMGGPGDFKMFSQGQLLGEFIDWIAATTSDTDDPTALVLNGDSVDFLAETTSDGDYLNPDLALARLQRIVQDPAFSQVWAALRGLMAKRNCRLVLVLGNHDLELALPEVREWLSDFLTDNDPAAAGRILFHLDGAGFACRVGGQRVLCVHGNEEDTWNLVDHFQLVRLCRTLNRNSPTAPWRPNAGTRMVVDVMNPIKRRWPFVDLLKPESRAALPAVAILDPGITLKHMTELDDIALTMQADQVKHAMGFLKVPPGEMPREQPVPAPSRKPEEVVLEFLGREFGWSPSRSGDAALEQQLTEAYLRAQTEPEDAWRRGTGAAEAMGGTARLGVLDDAVQWGRDMIDKVTDSFGKLVQQKQEAMLFQALNKLAQEQIFDLEAKDDFLDMYGRSVQGPLAFVIAGHTHLHRAINGRSRFAAGMQGGCCFFNTGTWADLIELPREWRENEPVFHRVFEALQAGTKKDLETLKGLPAPVYPPDARRGAEYGERRQGLILRRPTVAVVALEGAPGSEQVVGRLAMVDVNGAGLCQPLYTKTLRRLS